jgi:hypothetical protein
MIHGVYESQVLILGSRSSENRNLGELFGQVQAADVPGERLKRSWRLDGLGAKYNFVSPAASFIQHVLNRDSGRPSQCFFHATLSNRYHGQLLW